MLKAEKHMCFPLDLRTGTWIETGDGPYQIAGTPWLADGRTVAVPVHTTYVSDVVYYERDTKIEGTQA